jgi:transcriptional regulator with XRE-family HTH domain
MELRKMRQSLGMTQRELAEALNVPQATISRWERGPKPGTEGTDIRHPTILKLAMQHLRCKRKKR